MRFELEIAKKVAREAGKIILRYFNGHYEVREKGKSKRDNVTNPVTSADYASNNHLKEVIQTHFPEDGWFSEETADSPERLSKERVWIVDPLDGTIEFIEKVSQFVVSIALVIDHIPQLGVLHNPMTKETFTAIRGEGAWLNDQPIRCTSNNSTQEMVILNSRTETKKGMWEPYREFFKELRPIGSVAYKLGLTAAGKADIFASLRPKNEWDICAGHCILEAAGGMLVTLDGKAVTYNNRSTIISPGFVSGHPEAVRKVLEILQQRSYVE